MPLIIHDPASIPTQRRIKRVILTSPIVDLICFSKVLQGTRYTAMDRQTHTAMPISKAIWLPPLSESLPKSEITNDRKPINTTTGMMATKG